MNKISTKLLRRNSYAFNENIVYSLWLKFYKNTLDSATQSIVGFQKHWQCRGKCYIITLDTFWPCAEKAPKDSKSQKLKLDDRVKIWIKGDKL